MPGVELLGSLAKKPSVLDVIRSLQKGDVVALRYDGEDYLVFVENNRSDRANLEGVEGYTKGSSGSYDDSRWFYHERVTHIELVARKGTFAAQALDNLATKKYMNEKRLERIDERKREEHRRLDAMFE